jgi:citrate/tricarballylate utilization protein
MMLADLKKEGEHLMTVCNACRYCEGYCAVWQSMEKRLSFAEGDLNYLANLCHNCSACFYSCQYATPHEFNLNPPKTLAKIRLYTYELYAWPGPMAKAFQKNGLIVALVVAALLMGFMVAGSLLLGGRLFEPVVGGDFYQIIPAKVMQVVFSTVAGFAALAVIIGFLRFWRDVGEPYRALFNPAALLLAAKDVLKLTNLDNGGEGCSVPAEKSSEALRWFHHATFYGFLSCFVATSLGAFYYDVLGRHGPQRYTDPSVIFGILGGIGLIIGPLGLWAILQRRDPALIDKSQTGMNVAFIALLLLISVSGFLLLTLRETAALGTLLLIHLSFVMTLFLTIPYGKFVHGVYRAGALLKWALERSREPKPAPK